jgi:16S rRNA (uracil1498-N3)-methyltransferase
VVPATDGHCHSSPRLLREAAALVYVDELSVPELQSDDAYHLSVVLRLRPGEVVVASDGAGSYRACRVAPPGSTTRSTAPATGGSITGAGESAGAAGEPARVTGRRRTRSTAISLVPDTDVLAVRRAAPAITVGFSLAKADRTDWAVAKLAELGVDRIVPLLCARTVAGAGGAGGTAAGAKRTERLRRIARAASMQARRLWLPEVDEPLPFDDALLALAVAGASTPAGPAGSAAGDGSSTPTGTAGTPAGGQQNLRRAACGIALAEPGGATLSLATPVLLVGPEGGWSPAELAVGLPTVDLGATILRVETAAIVAGTLLTGLRSGLVSPSA